MTSTSIRSSERPSRSVRRSSRGAGGPSLQRVGRVDEVDPERCPSPPAAGRWRVQRRTWRRMSLGAVGAGLEAHPHPAVALVRPRELRAATVSANTKKRVVSPRVASSRSIEQGVLVVEHGERRSRDVAAGLAVDRVADGHVVGGDGLGDRAGRPADPEEPAGHLLAGADLREGPVNGGSRLISRAFWCVSIFPVSLMGASRTVKPTSCYRRPHASRAVPPAGACSDHHGARLDPCETRPGASANHRGFHRGDRP